MPNLSRLLLAAAAAPLALALAACGSESGGPVSGEAIAPVAAPADKDGVNSTPTFLLNGTAIDETSWAALEPMLLNAGAR